MISRFPIFTTRPRQSRGRMGRSVRRTSSVTTPTASSSTAAGSTKAVQLRLARGRLANLYTIHKITSGHAGRLASKHALIAEKAEGHHAHLASILNGVHWRNPRRDGQHKSEKRRAEPAGPTWMHSFTRAFLSTDHVKEPDPPGAGIV